MNEKNLYIIAGCNGAGKTTASFTILPETLNCHEFVNADEIAKGLSPFQPESAAIPAARIMLERIKTLLNEGKTFAFETTLATRSYKKFILEAHSKGYQSTLLFFWLSDVNLAKERVRTRVLEGGHNIPEKTIEERYQKGIKNLFELFLPVSSNVFIFDNSIGASQMIAEYHLFQELVVHQEETYHKLLTCYDNCRTKN